jgi:hypothetical protein
MNSHADHLDPVLQKMKEMKKNSILSHTTLLCVLVASKIPNLQYENQKNTSQKGYHV